MILIKEFEQDYFIDENGNMYKKLKPFRGSGGYLDIKDKNGKHHNVHTTVAKAFVENPNNYPVVNHKDENKQNNYKGNLEWCTQLDNIHHYLNNGGTPIKRFTQCKLYKNDELLGEFKSIIEASRYAKTLGAKQHELAKHYKQGEFKIVKG